MQRGWNNTELPSVFYTMETDKQETKKKTKERIDQCFRGGLWEEGYKEDNAMKGMIKIFVKL